MLRGQGGYKIRLELAILTPGCPLKQFSRSVDPFETQMHLIFVMNYSIQFIFNEHNISASKSMEKQF